MAFESTFLEEEIHIERIYTIHYFEYMSNFDFPGERHDFWEFQCVDKGQAEVCTDNGTYTLNRGQIIFHKPNEFHTLKAAGNTAPNIVVVSFECNSSSMAFFENQLLTLSETERNLMGMLIAEARRCIATPLDDPYTEKMEKRTDPLFGSQQLIRIYLEQMLLLMIRRYTVSQLNLPAHRRTDSPKYAPNYAKILFYLEEHIRTCISIEDICR